MPNINIWMHQNDVYNLYQAADALCDSFHSNRLRDLAESIQEALNKEEPQMSLPGPDGEPNELVPVSTFTNLTRSWDVV